MLVLSRKLGERIVVPSCELSITVVSIEGNTIRLGITAPPEIGVYREESGSESAQRKSSEPHSPKLLDLPCRSRWVLLSEVLSLSLQRMLASRGSAPFDQIATSNPLRKRRR